jgi:hypothetical protein
MGDTTMFRGKHVVVTLGDTVSEIAAAHGLSTDDVWGHPMNISLVLKRGQCGLIQPGDKIWIPADAQVRHPAQEEQVVSPDPLTDTQREIRQVCDDLCELLIQKNRAYGDSALSPMRVFSRADAVEQIKVRIDDKLSRLSRGYAMPDESLDDTISDLMGYLVLLRVAVRRKKAGGA